jgi:hypothetical protein
MRSVSVVFPESICAEMPMLRSLSICFCMQDADTSAVFVEESLSVSFDEAVDDGRLNVPLLPGTAASGRSFRACRDNGTRNFIPLLYRGQIKWLRLIQSGVP